MDRLVGDRAGGGRSTVGEELVVGKLLQLTVSVDVFVFETEEDGLFESVEEVSSSTATPSGPVDTLYCCCCGCWYEESTCGVGGIDC